LRKITRCASAGDSPGTLLGSGLTMAVLDATANTGCGSAGWT